MTTPSEEADPTLELQKYFRSQIEYIKRLRSEIKRIRYCDSMTIESELFRIRKHMLRLGEEVERYLNPIPITPANLGVYIATDILIDTAKSEFSELEKDWQEQFKRY